MKLVVDRKDRQLGYLYLSKHPGEGRHGVIKKTIDLSSVLGEYVGADIHLHFDEANQLIGIEIME